MPRKTKKNRLLASKCWYCGRQLTRRTKTRDHVLPRCMGGLTQFGNIVPACRRCNEWKAAFMLDTFRLVFWLVTGTPIFHGESEQQPLRSSNQNGKA
jgi:5-methylcytosine-specific restriction endonuclease McrA